MPKPIMVVAGVVGLAIIGGGVFLATNSKGDKTETNQSQSSSTSSTPAASVDDPEGVYKLFSDPSVTKSPEKDAVFGNGQTFTFEYDGSKTANDEYATLSYQLYYVQDDGKVQPVTGGNLDGKGKGIFTTSDKVFTSNANGKQGFFELIGTHSTSASDSGQIAGSNVTLGMYAIKFEVAE